MRIGVRQPQVRAFLTRLLKAGLAAVDPVCAVRRNVKRVDTIIQVGRRRYDQREYRQVVAVGAGKAAARMGAALENLLGNRLGSGLVVVKYGHVTETRMIEVLEAGHPLPDRSGQKAAERLLGLVRKLAPNDLLFVLLSGGASSLLPMPAGGLTLADKQKVTQLLLRSGAGIQEINTVRKHLSAIKGGRLAAATAARVVSLIMSDVIGDDLEAIGSGPTAPDHTTYADACRVLQRYRLWADVPARVRTHLAGGVRGAEEETPKPGSSLFRRVQNHIIGNNGAAVKAVAQAARQSGFRPLVLSTSLIGEARGAAKSFGAIAREIVTSGRPVRRPACVVAGGELTVTVRGSGRGGRAQEFALAASLEIAGLPKVWIAAFATDGTDGPTDAAGAVVDGQTVARAQRVGLNPHELLLENNAYRFFKKVGGHIITGPTGTNVNDLHLLIAP